MKRFTVLFFGILLLSAVPVGLAVHGTAGEPVDGVHVHGISERSENAVLRIAVIETSRTAYPVITWFIYTPAPAEVVHAVNGVETARSTVAAGYHIFAESYEDGQTSIAWTVDGKTWTFNVRITSMPIIMDDDSTYATVTMFAHELESRINSTVAISLGCMLLAFPFMTRYWKERKSEGFEDVI